METAIRSGIYPCHSTRHVDGRDEGLFIPEAPSVVDVTVPLMWGTSLTVRRRQLAAWTRGGSP